MVRRARHVTLWPKGLIGRVTAVILAAVSLQFLGSILLQDQLDRYTLREDHARRVAELLVVGDRLVQKADPAQRRGALEVLSTEHLKVELVAGPPAIAAEDVDDNRGLDLQALRDTAHGLADVEPPAAIRVAVGGDQQSGRKLTQAVEQRRPAEIR